MAITIYDDLEQNTPEWLALRENKVTGSIAYILLRRGLEHALKVNINHLFKGNYWTERGHTLEAEVMTDVYPKVFDDVDLLRPAFVTNSKYPNAGCSPDAIHGDIMIEVKCFKDDNHLAIRSVKDIPAKIMAQIQFNMMICGLKKARLVMYNPDLDDLEKCLNIIAVPLMRSVISNIESKLKGDKK